MLSICAKPQVPTGNGMSDAAPVAGGGAVGSIPVEELNLRLVTLSWLAQWTEGILAWTLPSVEDVVGLREVHTADLLKGEIEEASTIESCVGAREICCL